MICDTDELLSLAKKTDGLTDGKLAYLNNNQIKSIKLSDRNYCTIRQDKMQYSK